MSRTRVFWSVIPIAFLPLAAPSPARPPAKAVVVKMVDVSPTEFKFEPAQVTLAPGDTLRFIQTSATPHNVDLRDAPANASVGEAQMGPFLVTTGEAYTLVLDTRFPAGTYQYVCTPHEMMGMKASFTVTAR